MRFRLQRNGRLYMGCVNGRGRIITVAELIIEAAARAAKRGVTL